MILILITFILNIYKLEASDNPLKEVLGENWSSQKKVLVILYHKDNYLNKIGNIYNSTDKGAKYPFLQDLQIIGIKQSGATKFLPSRKNWKFTDKKVISAFKQSMGLKQNNTDHWFLFGEEGELELHGGSIPVAKTISQHLDNQLTIY